MVVASYERSGAAFRAPQLSSVSIPPCSGRGPILRPPSPERRGGQGVRSYRGVGVLGPRRRPRAAAAPATSAPASAAKTPAPSGGTSVGFGAWLIVQLLITYRRLGANPMSSCT